MTYNCTNAEDTVKASAPIGSAWELTIGHCELQGIHNDTWICYKTAGGGRAWARPKVVGDKPDIRCACYSQLSPLSSHALQAVPFVA